MMLCWGVSAAAMAAYVYSVAREITYVTLPDGRKAERKIPLAFRLLLPFAPKFSRVASLPAFAKTREAAGKMLVEGGLEGLLSPVEFVSLKLLVPMVFGLGWCVFVVLLATIFPDSVFSGNAVPLMAVGLCFSWFYPLQWLRNARKNRHLSIMRSLPFVLDLLTLSVEAGMDFMSALRRNCERAKVDALNEELSRMSYEVQMGFSIEEDFGPGRFKVEESGAAMSMLRIIKQAFEGDLAQYVKEGRKLKVKVTGMADALPIARKIPYDGCYGEYRNEPVYKGKELSNITLTKEDGITKNEQLAMLRALGVSNYVNNNINGISKMNADYEYYIEISEEKGGEYRRINLEMIFIDAL
jgi:hypothetical protein